MQASSLNTKQVLSATVTDDCDDRNMYREGKQNTPDVICLVSSIRPHTGVIDHTAFAVMRELSDTRQSCSPCVGGREEQSFLTIFCSSFNEELIKELN